MSKESAKRRSNVSGILAVGGGAVVGTIFGISFLASKNDLGLLGPIIGALVGGLLYRLAPSDETMNSNEPDNPSSNDRIAEKISAVPAAVAFLILGPTLGGCMGYFHDDGRFFAAVLVFGTIAGIAGFVGCLCIGSSK